MKKMFSVISLTAIALVLILALTGNQIPVANADENLQMISVNKKGNNSGNGESYFQDVSADGRFVAFTSTANNLTSISDKNLLPDVFVRDLRRGTTTMVSVNKDGNAAGNKGSTSPSISDDGRYIAYYSDATNLVTTPVNPLASNVYVRDMVENRTILVSINRNRDRGGNQHSFAPTITPDGRYVVFASVAIDLVEGADNNQAVDVFIRDLKAGVTKLVSVNRAGTGAGNQGSSFHSSGGVIEPVLSDDGRFVAFPSFATNLVSIDDNNEQNDIFVRDMVEGVTRLVSVNLSGTGVGNDASELPKISGNGRFVIFNSESNNLAANDPLTQMDGFLRVLQTGTTTLITVDLSGASCGGGVNAISDDGRFVMFSTGSNNVVPNDTSHSRNIFVRDMLNGTVKMASVAKDGTGGGNKDSVFSSMSADGRFIAFQSEANNLTDVDPTKFYDHQIYLRDMQAETTTMLSLNTSGILTGAEASTFPIISKDGRVVVFDSDSTGFGLTDNNNAQDLFAFGTPAPPPAPEITAATVNGKQLIVTGRNFDKGAAIWINEQKQKTKADSQESSTILVANKAGKKVRAGDKIKVVNSTGTQSAEFTFGVPQQ
jgi:Tol biopolymer transport system component